MTIYTKVIKAIKNFRCHFHTINHCCAKYKHPPSKDVISDGVTSHKTDFKFILP